LRRPLAHVPRVLRDEQPRPEPAHDIGQQPARVDRPPGTELADRVPDPAGVTRRDGGVERTRGDGRAELCRRLQFDRAEQRLGHGLDQRDPGRVRPHLPRGEECVQAALAVSGGEQRLRTRLRPRRHTVGGRGLPDEVSSRSARVRASARAGPAGEVLVGAGP
jgi:hypothetical protein